MTKVSASSYRAILRDRNISLLFLAQTISLFCSWISLVALNVRIYDLTKSSLGVAGVFLLTALPSLLIGIVGGVFVDRFNRQKLLVWMDVIRAVLTIPLLFVNDLVVLYTLVFLIAMAGVIYRTARLAIVPQLTTRPEDLLPINALLTITQTLTLALGPAIGGLLVAYIGVNIAFGLDAASFAISAALTLLITLPKVEFSKMPAGRTWTQIKQAFGFLATNRPILIVVLVACLTTLGGGSINALEIVYARKILFTDDTGYGLLISSWGLGLFLGTFWSSQIIERFDAGRVFIFSTCLLGLTLAVYGYITNLWLVLPLGVIGGICNGLQLTLMQTLLQKLTPPEMLGRIAGFFTTARDVTTVVSIGLAALLADYIGVVLVFAICGILIVLTGLLPALLTENHKSRLDWLAIEKPVEQKV